MSKLFSLGIILIVFPGCRQVPRAELPDSEFYFLFSHVTEVYSSEDSRRLSSFKLHEAFLTQEEKDTLVVILNEFGWQYKVTTENDVLIRKSSVGDLYNLSELDNQLKIRMAK